MLWTILVILVILWLLGFALKVGQVWLAWTENPNDELTKKLKKEKGLALTALRMGLSQMQMAGDPDGVAELSGILEFFGGLLIMFGLFTRPVAFLLSGQMAFAYFKVHAPEGFWPAKNQGESAVVFCFIFLFLVFAGAGPLSLDALLFGRY